MRQGSVWGGEACYACRYMDCRSECSSRVPFMLRLYQRRHLHLCDMHPVHFPYCLAVFVFISSACETRVLSCSALS